MEIGYFWTMEKLFGDNSRYVFERILQTNPELQSVWTRKKSIYNELIKMNLPVCYMYSNMGLQVSLEHLWSLYE